MTFICAQALEYSCIHGCSKYAWVAIPKHLAYSKSYVSTHNSLQTEHAHTPLLSVYFLNKEFTFKTFQSKTGIFQGWESEYWLNLNQAIRLQPLHDSILIRILPSSNYYRNIDVHVNVVWFRKNQEDIHETSKRATIWAQLMNQLQLRGHKFPPSSALFTCHMLTTRPSLFSYACHWHEIHPSLCGCHSCSSEHSAFSYPRTQEGFKKRGKQLI